MPVFHPTSSSTHHQSSLSILIVSTGRDWVAGISGSFMGRGFLCVVLAFMLGLQ